MQSKKSPAAAAANRKPKLVTYNIAAEPEHNAALARLAFIARRGVPPARAGVIAEIAFASGVGR